MIYEKRSTDNTGTLKITQKQCHINSFNTQNHTFDGRAAKAPLSNTVIFEKIHTRHKKSKRKKLGVLFCCVFILSVAFCFAAKPSLSPFVNNVKELFAAAFEKDDGLIFSPAFSPVEARTLYTVEYKDENVSQSTSSETPFENQPLQDTQEDKAVTTQQSGGSVYSDGVRFFPITELDLSGEITNLSNETRFLPDTQALLEKTPSALENIRVTDEPLVLIIHTHAGECYTEHKDMYPENEPTRNYDSDNMLKIGQEVKNALSDFGISCIHSEKMHDKESFINAYSSSAKTVKEYLQQYPSIKFVIDIHRDAIVRSDGESIKPVVEIAGQKYAQLMFVVGTNQQGHNHPDWQQNLCLALNLMEEAQDYYPGLFRSVNLRDVPFNQQLSTGYLLLEVGSCANLKEEALLSARAFGQSLASLIHNS